MRIIPAVFLIGIVILFIFSFGFVDPNLTLTSNTVFVEMQRPLSVLVFGYRPVAATVFGVLLVTLFTAYLFIYSHAAGIIPDRKRLYTFLFAISCILVLSFPALTYDIFNYITTAKVAFFYRENPYVIMPVDIPNEPYLAFTRAANKVALYGPVWILMTAIPSYLGAGNIWQTIIAFKLLNAVSYLLMAYLVFEVTKSVKNAVFFALNPLVLIETLVSSHNDIHMMLFAMAGLIIFRKNGLSAKLAGFASLVASALVKGATLVLLPLLFFKSLSWERLLTYAYWALAAVFFILAPIREELYPWYAVWLISVAAFLPLLRYKRTAEFTIVLSFALELRHIPYMVTGTYASPGPLLRVLVTIIPVTAYVLWVATIRRRV